MKCFLSILFFWVLAAADLRYYNLILLHAEASIGEKAIAYCTEVKEAYFDKIHYSADKLEVFVDDKEWYLPKYRELLFIR